MSDELYARLKVYEGRPAAVASRGKDPVNAPMIRHWCEAMGDTSPAYSGPDAIAPPTMLQAWTMGGLSGHTARTGAYDELLGLLDEAGYTSVVATDCEQEYPRALRPGDEITFDAVIEAVSERKTTKLGAGYFVTTRMDVRVDTELSGTHRFRILKYAPARRQTKQPRPRPVVNRDNADFWEGVRRRTLLIQRCIDCGALRHPWLPGCNACGGLDWATVEASGEGTVYSYVVMHHPPFPAFDPPYAVGLIELAEGVRMIGNVVGVPYDKVRIGLPVRLEFQECDEELVLPVWRVGEAAEIQEAPATQEPQEAQKSGQPQKPRQPQKLGQPQKPREAQEPHEEVPGGSAPRATTGGAEATDRHMKSGMARHLGPGTATARHMNPGTAAGKHVNPGTAAGKHVNPGTATGKHVNPGTATGKHMKPETATARHMKPETEKRMEPGEELPPLKIPITRTLIVAGAIASRDYQDVHHDAELARAKGSPDVFMNILTTNGLVGRYLTDHFGPTTVLRRVAIRLGAPNYPGDTMELTGTVEEVTDDTATVRVVGVNGIGRHVTGTATVSVLSAPAPSGGAV